MHTLQWGHAEVIRFHMSAPAQREEWIEFLRTAAAVGIVGVHATTDSSGQPYPDFSESERIFPILFRSVVYAASTELFIILSLFLLLSSVARNEQPYPRVVAQRATRLLVPFGFWVFFFAFFRLLKAKQFGYEAAILEELTRPEEWLGYFLLGDVQYHLHFIPTLFGLVLIYPTYRLAAIRPELGLLAVGCFWAKLVADTWLYDALAGHASLEYAVRLVKILSYAGYGLLAGSLLGCARSSFDPTTGRRMFLFACLIAALIYVVELSHAYLIIINGSWMFDYAPGYWADVLMPAALVFGVLSLRHLSFPGICARLAPLTYGIYLAHPAVMDVVEIAIAGREFSPTEMVLTKFLATLGGTVLIVQCVARIRWLSWTIGVEPVRRPA